MRILITGGAGYIGSHAVRCLRARGHYVEVVDHLHSTVPAEFVEAGRGVEVYFWPVIALDPSESRLKLLRKHLGRAPHVDVRVPSQPRQQVDDR